MAALEERPEPLNPVGVNVATDIFAGTVLDGLMIVLRAKWDDRLDRQEKSHLARFENAALRVDEGYARAFEFEICLQQLSGQLAVNFGEPSDMFEGPEPHLGVVGELIGSAQHCRPNRRLS